jgi:hypothetical protein
MTRQPDIHASQAIDPARLQFTDGVIGDLVEDSFEQREFIIGSYGLRRLGDDRSLVQVVVNALYRVVDVIGEFLGHFDIFLSAYVGEVTADECIKIEGGELVKYLQVLVEIRGDIETLKGSIARSYAVDGHEEFGLRDIDEEVAFVGVVEMARQFYDSPPSVIVFSDLKVTFGSNRLGSFISFKKSATLSRAMICRPLMFLNAAEPPM